MKIQIKRLLFLLLLIVLFPSSTFARGIEPIRLGGENRILTSIEISKNIYEKSDTVILVEYNNELEALLSTILSKKHDAPILITTGNKLSDHVKDEIERLQSTNVILVNKNDVFSKDVKESLTDLDVHEIIGDNVEELAINMLKEVYGGEKDEVFLTLGYGVFADALSIGSISADKDIPILLTHGEKISNTTMNALKDLRVKRVNIIGGKMAIHETVEQQLKSLDISFERTEGSNREDTAMEVAKKYNKDAKNIVIANGYNYADAVTGGYFAFKKDASILLAQNNKVNIDTLDYIKETANNLYVLGREKAIDDMVEKEIWYILNGYIIKEEEKTLNIPFKTVNKNDPTIEKGKTKIQSKGINGRKLIFDRVILRDKREIERKNIISKVIKNPIDEIILIGTKEINKVKKENLYFTTKNLHLKDKTSKNSKTLITIPKGVHLDYLSSEGAWYKVTYNNRTGYLPSNSVKKGTGYKVGDTLVVNKGYGLSSSFNPGVNPEALNAVNTMKKDAKRSGITLNVFSDFRTYQYQVNLYNRYVRKDGKKKADTYSARPGYSEHQTGLTFDIGGANSRYYVSQKFGQMKEGIWMAKNSYKYGLILRYPKGKEKITGYKYEPWHFRYVGVDMAKKVYNSRLTLDEYLGTVKPNY